MKDFESSLKIRKYEWIPLFGTIAYILRVEFVRVKIEEKKMRGDLGHYKKIFNILSMLVALPFLIVIIIWKVQHNPGMPFYFWIGLAIGLSQNITSLLPQYLFKLGIKRHLKKTNDHL